MGGLVFWNSVHLEVASNPFCLLCNCPWLLVFVLCLFFMILLGFNLYCWKGIHFSWSKFLISFSIFNRMGFWRILCSQSNIEEVFYLSFSTPISSLWFCSSSSFLSSFSIF